jgi:hypothetical protein
MLDNKQDKKAGGAWLSTGGYKNAAREAHEHLSAYPGSKCGNDPEFLYTSSTGDYLITTP